MKQCASPLLIGAVVAMLAGAVSATPIGVNFVDTGDGGVQNGTSDALAPAEVAGVPAYAQANWNNLGRWGATVGLQGGDGAATGVTITWDSNNTWNIGAGTSTPNRKLMNGYLDATGQPNINDAPYQFWWNENKPEAYVTGLSAWLASQRAPSYKVIVYTDGDVAEGRKAEYWLQASLAGDPPNTLGADLTPHVFAMDSANFQDSEAFTQIPTTANSVDGAVAGNYIVFEGLTADNFVLRTEEQTFRATINGIQIVPTPEPASISLLGLGVLGLLRRGRKSK
jgi:hypothetical protein